ncbi:MAG: hypothetical protein D8M59_01920 [Planctomycetes bacterium]|nr:hypothetical protein [Planctomycetota bacterium]
MLGSVVTLMAAVLIILVDRDWILAHPWFPFVLLPPISLSGFVAGRFRPVSNLQVARAVDAVAAGEDRFASAVQLAGNRNRERADRLIEDALKRVLPIRPVRVLPQRLWGGVAWAVLPLVCAITLVMLAPPTVIAIVPTEPGLTDSQWQEIQQQFEQMKQDLPGAQTPEAKDLNRRLEDLARLLSDKPDKKDALAAISRLRDHLTQQSRKSGTQNWSMQKSAKALARNKDLKNLSALLQKGEYAKAAAELKNLAEQLKTKQWSPTAEDYQQLGADLGQLAVDPATPQDLQQAAQECADAANSMSRSALEEALRRLAEQIEQDSKQLSNADSTRQAQSMLEQLERLINKEGQCSGCKEGCASCQGNSFVKGNKKGPGAGKGGLQAGRGSMSQWKGGGLQDTDEARQPGQTNVPEQNGTSTRFNIVSQQESATSGMTYEQMYAELVHQAEADLNLETLPFAYREYLRRYFVAIKPEPGDDAAATEQPTQPDKSPDEQ